MKATRIKMNQGCSFSNNIQEISKIYIENCRVPGWYDKAAIYDYLISNPNSIYVNISPYPYLLPARSIYGEKYVRSEPNDTIKDNLLKLPRE